MSLYEMVLRFPDKEEVRLTDKLPPADAFDLDGQRWRVVERGLFRVVCEQLRQDSRELRNRSDELQARSKKLRGETDLDNASPS